MPTDMPGWLQNARKDMQDRMHTPKYKPRPVQGAGVQRASEAQSGAIRRATAVSGHNVFRPDIYRVSEGYLN
jgi:hypothetical protein